MFFITAGIGIMYSVVKKATIDALIEYEKMKNAEHVKYSEN